MQSYLTDLIIHRLDNLSKRMEYLNLLGPVMHNLQRLPNTHERRDVGLMTDR